ncbi:aquaporin family protein [Burkholderiaceae bacterium DAT-1]|nr:aquaporin family protein [Burkholderiaceae bacterium DAT-1]
MALRTRLLAEAIGTAGLLAIVVGSGIMAEKLAGGNVAVALLANTIATGAGLIALIHSCADISGAHFNPVVTLIMAMRRELSVRDAAAYIVVQGVAAIAGVMLAHGMFEVSTVASMHVRTGASQWLSEGVATFGLIATILSTSRSRPHVTPFAVAAWIISAYWFTASTSFANPAVTLARSFTDTFAGIRPVDVPGFVLAQIAGALLASLLFRPQAESSR